jgi:DNA topoisomerase III
LVSAGRVQTPTLALVVDRENEINSFVPAEYWEVKASFTSAGSGWEGLWINPSESEGKRDTQVFEKAKALAVVSRVNGCSVDSVIDTTKEERICSPLPYDLTSLQRDANKKYGFSAADTLAIAQALYETHKVATYPRTSSAYLPSDAVDEVKRVCSVLPGKYGRFAQRALDEGWLSASHRVFDDSKISDHFAIIPTGSSANLDGREIVVYELIVQRFISCFFPPAVVNNTVRICCIGEDRFRTTGSVVVERGWWQVSGITREGVNLPLVAKDAVCDLDAVSCDGKWTQPPDRFTEASLLGAMVRAGRVAEDVTDAVANGGLGTPATRASVIEELLSARKGYLSRNGKMLVPTAKAEKLINVLRGGQSAALTSAMLTAQWEADLGKIERGELNSVHFEARIEGAVTSYVSGFKAKAAQGAPELKCRCEKGTMRFLRGSWACQCGLKIWKDVASRPLSVEEVSMLLRDGHTSTLHGFMSKKGNQFSAVLALGEDGKVSFVFEGGSR